MGIKKTIAAVLTIAMVLSITACANNENPNNGTENVSGNIKIKTDYKAMWKILPEIEETPIENLVYEYDIELAGMAVTGYKAQSPKVRIPDTIEGEPVVGVNLKDSTITEIIMPDTVKRAVLNKTCLQYANYPLSLDTYEDLFGEMSSYQSYSAPGSANEGFSGSTIEAVYIPNGVKYIPSSAFKNCGSLKTINLPNTVTSLGEDCFQGCKSLMSITFPDNLSYVADSSFSGGKDYENIVFTYKGKKYTYENANELYILINYRDGLMIKDGVLLDSVEDITEAVIPDTVTKIDDSAFSNRKNLRSVIIPDSVIEIGSSAFEDCTSLSSVTVPISVKEIGNYAFEGCTSLTSVTLSNSITEINESVFRGSENVVVTYKGKTYNYEHLSDWLVDAVNLGDSGMLIENGALKDVSRELTEVVIPINVVSIGREAFDGCTNLSSVTILENVTKIDERAFRGCENLLSVTIPDSVTNIGNKVFDNCTNIKVTYKGKIYDYEHLDDWLYDAVNLGESGMLIENGVLKDVSRELTEVVIPDSVTAIDSEAFEGCTRLSDITIPNSVTSIGSKAFSGCTSLSSITIPDSITTIGSEAFSGCTSFSSVTIPDSVIEMYGKAFDNCSNNIQVTYKSEVCGYEQINGGISNGQLCLVVIKDMTNKTETEAKQQLEADGFKVIATTHENSNDIAKNHVIRTTPTAHELAKRGSSVSLVISSGASKSIIVPNLVGLLLDEAVKRCEEYHLLVQWEIKSDSAKRGMVISQSIPENTSVDEHTSITLTVSEGTE